MKKAQNSRRPRARAQKRNNGQKGGNNGNRSMGQVKGNPKQQLEKYKALARDAQQAGDRILAENYLQHADHYQRVINERYGPPVEEPEVEDDYEDSEDEGEAEVQQQRPSRSRRARVRAAQEAEERDVNRTDPSDSDQPTENRDEREMASAELPLGDGGDAPRPKRRRGRPPKPKAAEDQATDQPAGDVVAG